MKSSLLALISIFAVSAFAADVGQITMSQPKTESLTAEKSNLAEGGFAYSSINDGSAYATVAMIHEFDNGFGLGVRGFLPMQFTSRQQSFMGQAVARFILLNENDQLYVEGTLAQGYFNGESDGEPFWTIGSDVGYMHHLDSKIVIGGTLGLDYSNRRITGGILSDQRTLYSKIGVIGAYYF